MGDFPVTETTPGSTLQDSSRVYQIRRLRFRYHNTRLNTS